MIPKLTTAQRLDSLRRATEARTERRRLRDALKSGDLTVGGLLRLSDGGDAAASRMRVRHMLESLPGVGRAKAAALMEELRISPRKRVGGLGRRQRTALAERVGEGKGY